MDQSSGALDEDNESVTMEASPEHQKVSWANGDSLNTFHLMDIKDVDVDSKEEEGSGALENLYNDSYSCIEGPEEGDSDDANEDDEESTVVLEGMDGEESTAAGTHITEGDDESTVAQHTLESRSTLADQNTFAEATVQSITSSNSKDQSPQTTTQVETADAENNATANSTLWKEQSMPTQQEDPGDESDEEDDDHFSVHLRDDATQVSGITGIGWGSDSSIFDSSLFDESTTTSISKNGRVQSLYSDDDEEDDVHSHEQQENSRHPRKPAEDVTEDETSSTNHSEEILVHVVHPDGHSSKLAGAGIPTKAAAALEQKRRERAARMARVKERIRLQNTLKEVNEAACQQMQSKSEKEAKKDMHLMHRRALAFRWYNRLARPNKTAFRKRIQKMIQTDGYCEISLEDIEALPWSPDGRRVDSSSSLVF